MIMNHTLMWHPIHLRGHTFQLVTAAGDGPRKDTVIVPPMGSLDIEFVADNPGQRLLPCHHIYHAAAGMMTTVHWDR